MWIIPRNSRQIYILKLSKLSVGTLARKVFFSDQCVLEVFSSDIKAIPSKPRKFNYIQIILVYCDCAEVRNTDG